MQVPTKPFNQESLRGALADTMRNRLDSADAGFQLHAKHVRRGALHWGNGWFAHCSLSPLHIPFSSFRAPTDSQDFPWQRARLRDHFGVLADS
jgi:hypothetical protein